jgi:IrrE N-terminal-like domain
MENPQEAAMKLLSSYFEAQGIECPVHGAKRLMARALVDPKTGAWQNWNLIEPAFQIIELMRYDVDDLVENHLDVRPSIESLEKLDRSLGSPVFGMARPNSRKIAVCERTLAYEPLYRATLMHEAGHVVLHGSRKSKDYPYTPFSRNRDSREQEANDFMRHILLPEDVLYLGVGLMCSLNGMQIEESIRSANSKRGRWQWRNKHFPFLINHLCVSRELILNVLRRGGVISNETYDFHKSYPLPNRWLNAKTYKPLAKVVARLRQAIGMVN